MSVRYGRVSLQAFAGGLGMAPVAFYVGLHVAAFYAVASASVMLYAVRFHVTTSATLQVAGRALGLGHVFAIGLIVSAMGPSSWSVFGLYLCLLAAFHYSEYYTTYMINPRSLSLDSFLLNHSREYGAAAVCSWTEYAVERYLFPGMKEFGFLSWLGLVLCVGGEVVRKWAMFTARSNFNHVVQIQREEGHVLVTHGIYSLCRHPSYAGWFWWSVGTQLLLCNPICVVGYAIASWRFFDARVQDEEITLLNFFGEDYVWYQRRVPTGLPFIRGYLM